MLVVGRPTRGRSAGRLVDLPVCVAVVEEDVVAGNIGISDGVPVKLHGTATVAVDIVNVVGQAVAVLVDLREPVGAGRGRVGGCRGKRRRLNTEGGGCRIPTARSSCSCRNPLPRQVPKWLFCVSPKESLAGLAFASAVGVELERKNHLGVIAIDLRVGPVGGDVARAVVLTACRSNRTRLSSCCPRSPLPASQDSCARGSGPSLKPSQQAAGAADRPCHRGS